MGERQELVTWTCLTCGHVERQPAGVRSVSHPCGKDHNRRHWLVVRRTK